MARSPRVRATVASTSLALVALLGCLDEDAIYDALPTYADPPAAAQGFLGYGKSTVRTPICGNCHVGTVAAWRKTRHAAAWTTLAESDQASTDCEPCHTVGSYGNWVTDPAVAWQATRDRRYTDVQCESCHGPGLEHVTNPDASQPLPSIRVGVGLDNGCGECHAGLHQPFVEEWSQSAHSKVNTTPQSRAACVQCHEARGIFRAWGIDAEYIEQNETAPIAITCAVCHDPHDATNGHQLRFPINVPNEDVNLCMKCHQRGGTPDPGGGGRPHSPQGPLLLGTAGWRPPGFAWASDTIVVTHGTERNQRMCAACHVARLEVTDAQTGAFVFQATGHLFQATPCLDADGKPTPTASCAVSERSFAACAISGCHTSEGTARAALSLARNRIDARVATLTALLAKVPSAEFNPNDNKLTTAEGAKFNGDLAALWGSPIHNPFLTEALLDASIQRVQADYGVTPVAPASPPRTNR